MFTFKIKTLVLFVGVLIIMPNFTFAYFTTGQSATKINDNTLLYTVTYKFGMKNAALRMPIGVVRGLEFATTSPYVGYDLLKDSETLITGGESYSLVLSNAKIENNEYYVPKGQGATFTLVTLVKLGTDTASLNDDAKISLQVTSLPFKIISGGKESNNRLNPSELQYYLTPEIDIK